MTLYELMRDVVLVVWRAKGYEWSTRKAVSAATTLSRNDGRHVEGDTSSAGFAVTIPDSPQDGEEWRIRKSVDANALQIIPSTGKTIQGAASLFLMNPGEGVTIRYSSAAEDFRIVGRA